MSPKKGLLKGSKISSNHSTVIADAEILVIRAKSLVLVSKIVLGIVVPLKPGRKRLKFMATESGWRMVVRGANVQQTFYLYTTKPQEVREALILAWDDYLG